MQVDRARRLREFVAEAADVPKSLADTTLSDVLSRAVVLGLDVMESQLAVHEASRGRRR